MFSLSRVIDGLPWGFRPGKGPFGPTRRPVSGLGRYNRRKGSPAALRPSERKLERTHKGTPIAQSETLDASSIANALVQLMHPNHKCLRQGHSGRLHKCLSRPANTCLESPINPHVNGHVQIPSVATQSQPVILGGDGEMKTPLPHAL